MRLFRRERARCRCTSSSQVSAPGAWSTKDRHNVGWMVVDELARRHQGSFKGKFRGKLADVRLGDAKLALLKPETYMNESGASIQAAAAFYKAPLDRVLVVHDDVDPETARLQARLGGGLAGHNGLRSISQRLGTPDFLRLRSASAHSPGAAIRGRSRTTSSRRSHRRTTSGRSWSGHPMRLRRWSARGSRKRSAASTELAVTSGLSWPTEVRRLGVSRLLRGDALERVAHSAQSRDRPGRRLPR